jgi:hypothetical protein
MADFDIYVQCNNKDTAKILYDTIKEKFSQKMMEILMSAWADNFAFDSKQANVQFQDSTQKLIIDALKFDFSETFPVDDILHIDYGEERRVYNPYVSW